MIWRVKWFRLLGFFLSFLVSAWIVLFLWWENILIFLGTLLIVVLCLLIFFLQYYDDAPKVTQEGEKQTSGKALNAMIPIPLMLWGIFVFALSRSPIPRESTNIWMSIFIVIRLIGVSFALQIALSWFTIRIYILQQIIRNSAKNRKTL